MQFTKSPIRPAHSNFAKRWGMRKRYQNHFRLHFTSKTPYLFDTRGILGTPACDVHGRLKIRSKVIRKRSIYLANQDNNYNSTKHLEVLQFFIYEDVYWEWSVSEYPESRIKPCKFKKPPSPCFGSFSRWTPGKNIAQSFLFTNNRISLFLSSHLANVCKMTA